MGTSPHQGVWKPKHSSLANNSTNKIIFRRPFVFSSLYIWHNGENVHQCFPGDQSSIPGRVVSKTQKIVLDASLLNTQYYKVQIRGKWSNPRKGVAPSLTCRGSSYWKGAFRLPFTMVGQLSLLSIQSCGKKTSCILKYHPPGASDPSKVAMVAPSN